MNRAEKLQEQYEDALFALLMDRIVVSEGEAALKEMEMLEEDPDFIVPDSCIHRCQQIISDCAKGYRRLLPRCVHTDEARLRATRQDRTYHNPLPHR